MKENMKAVLRHIQLFIYSKNKQQNKNKSTYSTHMDKTRVPAALQTGSFHQSYLSVWAVDNF